MQEINTSDLDELASMLAAGTLKSAIGQHLSGLSAIPNALSGHSDTLGPGHTSGKTVISISDTTMASADDNNSGEGQDSM